MEAKIKPDYRNRINSRHNPNVQFATLAHELGHLFLGHLGPDKYLKIPERPSLTHARKELEAESLAYIVCKRTGIVPTSESYLASYVASRPMVEENLDIYPMLKAAGPIETLLELTGTTHFDPAALPARPRPQLEPTTTA
jgi:antirestriction protein ArdC